MAELREVLRLNKLRNKGMTKEEIEKRDKKNLRKYKRLIKEADEKITELKNRIKELQEIKQQKEILFPFQKNELINKELELLETKLDKGANLARINMVKGDIQRVKHLGEINRELKKKIREKEKEQKQFRKDNFNLTFKGIHLYTDPREDYQEAMKQQEICRSLIRMLNEMIDKLKSARQLNGRIERSMGAINDFRRSERNLINFDGHIEYLKTLRDRYDRQTAKVYKFKLQKIEKKLEEWREQEIQKLKDEEKIKSEMLDLV